MVITDESVRFSGSNVAGQRHICAFFNNTDEQHRVLRSFIKDGFDKGDKVFHLVNPDLREAHLRHLTDAGVDVQKVSASGQLEVRSWKDTYLRGDRFDQDAMLALVEEVLQTGHTEGYSLTRLLAHMEWALVDKQGVEDLLEYETRLNYVIPKYDNIVICAYDLSKFSANVAIDAMRTHPVVIVGGLLHENPFFVPPEQFLLELKERRLLRQSVA
jgi:hypothetical protein